MIVSEVLVLNCLLLKMLRVVIQYSIKTFEVNLIATISICGLNNNVIHSSVAAQLRCYEIVFDVRCLVLFHFRLGNLSVFRSFSSVMKQNLNLAHLDFCRGDLDRVGLSFKDASCLVWAPNRGLPRRFFFSIKLIS